MPGLESYLQLLDLLEPLELLDLRLQLRVADAEMLTPGFGELQGRTACQGWDEAQHNAAKRIRSPAPLTFPFTHLC